MKIVYIVSILCLALAAGIAVQAWQNGTNSDLEPGRREGDSSAVLAGIGRLNERLDGLEARLEVIPRLEAEIAALRKERSAASSPGDDSTAEETSRPRALAELLEKEGAEEILRDFIADVYYKERDQRKKDAKTQADEKRREREELSEGPYGKYNYRVNSLTKKLEMNSRQEQFVYELLQDYDERKKVAREEIRSAIDLEKPNRETMQILFTRIEESRKDLGNQFETDLAAVLTPTQKEVFQELPSRERRGESGSSGMQIFSESAADIGTILRVFGRSEKK